MDKTERIKALRDREGIGMMDAKRQIEREDRRAKRAELRGHVQRHGVTRDAFLTLLNLLEETD